MAKRSKSKSDGTSRFMTTKMEAALRRHLRAKGADYLKDPNITSVGIGFKNGDGPISLQFSVVKKVEDSVVETVSNWPIPKMIEVEGTEIPTDVIERNFEPSYDIVKVEAMDDRRMRAELMRPGMSCSHIDVSAGTIGLIVFDRRTGAPCILSNWHVLHGPTGEIGDPVVQPGISDDNNIAGNLAGELLRSYLGPPGDCALARIRTRGFDRNVLDLDVAPKRMARVALGDSVIKSGRTTGTTHGLVRRVDVMVKIGYDGLIEPQIIGCFEIGVDPGQKPVDGEISMGGDSGSAWLIAEENAATDIFAGLHFAGESGTNPDEHALACYAASVQKKLDFVLEPLTTAIMDDDAPEVAVERLGYDPDFLGVSVPMPGLPLTLKRDAVNFGREQWIPYTHFSVCLSARRKLARFVAWNVDGARQVKLPRRGFKLDPRIDAKVQTGEDLYVGNALDR